MPLIRCLARKTWYSESQQELPRQNHRQLQLGELGEDPLDKKSRRFYAIISQKKSHHALEVTTMQVVVSVLISEQKYDGDPYPLRSYYLNVGQYSLPDWI